MLSPGTLLSAYGLIGESFTTNSGFTIAADGTGLTIAIVAPYYDPYLPNDLAAFDSYEGVKPPPFLQQYPRDQNSPPNGIPLDSASNDPTGMNAQETAQDVEWAHAVAPGAAILVSEAPSVNVGDLARAAYTAAGTAPGGLPVVVVSLSYYATDVSGDSSLYDPYFTTPPGHAPVTFIASSGDVVPNPTNLPPDASYPAASPNVVSVGGTSLGINPKYSLELAWNYDSFSGSGEPGPSFSPPPYYPGEGSGAGLNVEGLKADYQQTVYPTYPARVFPDVSFDADPVSGGVEYATTPESHGQFLTADGTSLSAPCWAGIITILDQGLTINGFQSETSEATLTRLYNLFVYYELDNPNLPQPYHSMYSSTHYYFQNYGGNFQYELTQTGLGSPNGYDFLVEFEAGKTQVNPPAGGASAPAPTSQSAPSIPQGPSLALTVLDLPTSVQAAPAAASATGELALASAVDPNSTVGAVYSAPTTIARVINPAPPAASASPSGNGGRVDASRSILVTNTPIAPGTILGTDEDEAAPTGTLISSL